MSFFHALIVMPAAHLAGAIKRALWSEVYLPQIEGDFRDLVAKILKKSEKCEVGDGGKCS